jgi:hypothetical protein
METPLDFAVHDEKDGKKCILLLFCSCFAVALQLLCNCFAVALQSLSSCVAVALQSVYNCFAVASLLFRGRFLIAL